MSQNALQATPVSVSASESYAMTGQAAADPGPAAKRLAALGPEQRAATARRMEVLGAISQGLAGRPYGERRAILGHMAPQLAAQGAPPAMIAAFDPTDTNLAAAAREAEAVRGMLSAKPQAT